MWSSESGSDSPQLAVDTHILLHIDNFSLPSILVVFKKIHIIAVPKDLTYILSSYRFDLFHRYQYQYQSVIVNNPLKSIQPPCSFPLPS